MIKLTKVKNKTVRLYARQKLPPDLYGAQVARLIYIMLVPCI
jgi:hypothetical protein